MSGMPRSVTSLLFSFLFSGALVASVAGCGHNTLASTGVTAADQVDGPQTKYIYGTVTKIPNDLYYNADIEINGVDYSLADVWTNFDLPCGDINNEQRNAHILQTLHDTVPVGTKVVGLLAEYSRKVVFLQRAPGGGPTINEIMLRSGYASDNAADATSWPMGWRELTDYHQAALAAERAGKSALTGGGAACRAAEAASERTLADQQKQWAVGGGAGDSASGPNAHVDWGDGHCTTCSIGRRVFGHLR